MKPCCPKCKIQTTVGNAGFFSYTPYYYCSKCMNEITSTGQIVGQETPVEQKLKYLKIGDVDYRIFPYGTPEEQIFIDLEDDKEQGFYLFNEAFHVYDGVQQNLTVASSNLKNYNIGSFEGMHCEDVLDLMEPLNDAVVTNITSLDVVHTNYAKEDVPSHLSIYSNESKQIFYDWECPIAPKYSIQSEATLIAQTHYMMLPCKEAVSKIPMVLVMPHTHALEAKWINKVKSYCED